MIEPDTNFLIRVENHSEWMGLPIENLALLKNENGYFRLESFDYHNAYTVTGEPMYKWYRVPFHYEGRLSVSMGIRWCHIDMNDLRILNPRHSVINFALGEWGIVPADLILPEGYTG